MTDDTNNTEEAVAASLPQVTAGDLALLVKIIDAGSERGAWRGAELETIGIVRSKMAAIVQAVTPTQNTNESEEDTLVEEELKEITSETPTETSG